MDYSYFIYHLFFLPILPYGQASGGFSNFIKSRKQKGFLKLFSGDSAFYLHYFHYCSLSSKRIRPIPITSFTAATSKLTGAIMLIFFPKLFFAIFWLIEIIIRGIFILLNKVFKTAEKSILRRIAAIRIFSFAGLIVFIFLFFIILQGLTIGRTNFETTHIKLSFKNLPKSFDGLRIAQISDMHLGSFYDSLMCAKA